MADHHEEEQLGKLYDAKAARRLIKYLAPYRRLVVIALSLTILLNLVRQLGPLLTKWAIDDYVAPAAQGACVTMGRCMSTPWSKRRPRRAAARGPPRAT